MLVTRGKFGGAAHRAAQAVKAGKARVHPTTTPPSTAPSVHVPDAGAAAEATESTARVGRKST